MCVTVSVVEGVDVSGGGGSFRLPGNNYATSSVYYLILRLWAVPVLAAKLSNQGGMFVRSPFYLRVTPSLSPACGL